MFLIDFSMEATLEQTANERTLTEFEKLMATIDSVAVTGEKCGHYICKKPLKGDCFRDSYGGAYCDYGCHLMETEG